jgi:hypothetical protein
MFLERVIVYGLTNYNSDVMYYFFFFFLKKYAVTYLSQTINQLSPFLLKLLIESMSL